MSTEKSGLGNHLGAVWIAQWEMMIVGTIRGPLSGKEKNGIKKHFGIDPTGTGWIGWGGKGEKDNKDESQSFSTNKWEEKYHVQRRGVFKEENNRIGWAAMELKSFPLHKFDMLMIQPSGDIKQKVVCMILELGKEVCNVALYCCLCCYCNKNQYQ